MIKVMKAQPRLRARGTCTQLEKALGKMFTEQEIDYMEFGVDTEDDNSYNWHLTYKRQDFVLSYEKRTGIITFGKENEYN